jgi:hypothetical protein
LVRSQVLYPTELQPRKTVIVAQHFRPFEKSRK